MRAFCLGGEERSVACAMVEEGVLEGEVLLAQVGKRYLEIAARALLAAPEWSAKCDLERRSCELEDHFWART